MIGVINLDINSKSIEQIVKQVLQEMGASDAPAKASAPVGVIMLVW